MLGISYGGWLTVMAMIDPHPALKAVSEQASPADQFLGDDFHHNGAFRLSYGLEYSAMMETGKTNFHFKFDQHDTFEWYLALGALSNFNTELRTRKAADVERFRGASQLRRVLAEAGGARRIWTLPRCRTSTWRAGGTRKISTVR